MTVAENWKRMANSSLLTSWKIHPHCRSNKMCLRFLPESLFFLILRRSGRKNLSKNAHFPGIDHAPKEKAKFSFKTTFFEHLVCCSTANFCLSVLKTGKNFKCIVLVHPTMRSRKSGKSFIPVRVGPSVFQPLDCGMRDV